MILPPKTPETIHARAVGAWHRLRRRIGIDRDVSSAPRAGSQSTRRPGTFKASDDDADAGIAVPPASLA